MFLGKKRHLPRRTLLLAEKLDALSPGSLLRAIEFTEIKHMALHDAAIVQPAVLDHTPVKMHFAILEPFAATQEHDGCRT